MDNLVRAIRPSFQRRHLGPFWVSYPAPLQIPDPLIKWPESTEIGGRIETEWVAGLKRNHCPLSTGIYKRSKIQAYLKEWLKKPPLIQLASTAALLEPEGREALKKLLTCYDEFIGLLDDKSTRPLFGNPDKPEFTRLESQVGEIGDQIQKSLETIFFDDSLFMQKIKKYGIF